MIECSVEYCGNPHKAKGLCNAHYIRLQRHGDPLAGGTQNGEPERFYREVVLPYLGDDCLAWPFARSAQGYGQVWVDGKPVLVSRLVCEEANGPPPTPKHEAAHSCGHGHLGCVTKDHLSWRTRLQNKADELTHGTRSRGERNGRTKITEDQAREILALKGSKPQRLIADRYGVKRQAISKIQTGKNWAWLSFEKEQ